MSAREDEDSWGEPAPTPNDGPSMHDLVIEDMQSRKAFGLAKYGTVLQAHNGRVPLKDAYEEAIDLVVYLRQALEEKAVPKPARVIFGSLDEAVQVREYTPGNPGDGPYPASVGDCADEIVQWLDAFAESAPGIHEAVANRIGMQHFQRHGGQLGTMPVYRLQDLLTCPQCGSADPLVTREPCKVPGGFVHKWHQEASR